MEDYPILGIRSMEDRTRLFHLVQMVKVLDLEYEDDDTDHDAECVDGDKGYPGAERSFYGCVDPDDDVCDDDNEKAAAVSKRNATHVSSPPDIHRRLDCNCETMDHHLKLFSCLEDTVHVCASRYRNNVADQGKESAIPVQLDTVSGCKGKNNHRPDFHSSFSNKLLGHKVRKGISRKEKLFCKINSNMATEHMAKPTPVYESKRTAGYNYGLPLSSPPAPNKK